MEPSLAEDAKFAEATPATTTSALSLSLDANPPSSIELNELFPSKSTDRDEKTLTGESSSAATLVTTGSGPDKPSETANDNSSLDVAGSSSSAGTGTGDTTDDTGDTNTIKDLKEIFARPLVYYKRNNPGTNRTRKQQTCPSGIVLPDQSVTVGFVPDKNHENQERERNLNENMLIFASPGDDQVGRNRVLAYLLYCLIPCDFILITVIFLQGGTSVQYPLSDGDQVVADGLSYSVTVMILVLGLLGMQLRDTRIITLFLVVFYVDSLLSLIRVYTVLQFSHYIIQLAICHIMSQFKSTLLATWFQPS